MALNDRFWSRRRPSRLNKHVGDSPASDRSPVTGWTMNGERWVPFTVQSNPAFFPMHGKKGMRTRVYRTGRNFWAPK
eukprot:364423-Chlamydomonas_euryale.AAC.1